MTSRAPLTVADLITLSGYAAGLWWSVGGPTWAALASIAADEVDGPVARAMGDAGQQGADIDWGADVALVPLALMRLGKEVDQQTAAIACAPMVLAVQARLRAGGWAPPIGSARAAIMLAAIVAGMKKPRENPRRDRRRLPR